MRRNVAALSFPSFSLPAPALATCVEWRIGSSMSQPVFTCELLANHAALDRIFLVRLQQSLLLQREQELVDVTDELAALVLQ